MQTDLFSPVNNGVSESQSLSEFLDNVKNAFDDFIGYKPQVVEFEVKSIKKVRQFYYLEIFELDNSWAILASVRANIFNPIVVESFVKRAKISHYNDIVWMKIQANIWPKFHKSYWFSVNIDKIFSQNTVWNIQISKDETIDYLKKSWKIFNNKNTTLWDFPYKIAIISSSTSEWLRDFLSILKDSAINFDYEVFDSHVWWNLAASSVSWALDKVRDKIDDFNFVVILRWWWASDGMHWTNDRALSEKICDFKIPVISAVWHTVDEWIIDIVSYQNCKTPSESAKFVIDRYLSSREHLDKTFVEIQNKYQRKINDYINFLDKISLISKNLDAKIASYKQSLDYIIKNIRNSSNDKILWKWFSILKDKTWKNISNPKVWDIYILQTKDWEFEIEIKKKG